MKKIDKNEVKAFMELYAQVALDTKDECDWHSDPRAVELLADVARGRDLSYLDFAGVNLKNAVLKGAQLSHANLRGAIFVNTTLIDCDLSGADLSGAHIENVHIYNSDLSGTNFTLAYIHKLKMDDTKIDDLTQQRLEALNSLTQMVKDGLVPLNGLSWVDLMAIDFSQLDISDIDLDEVDLSCIALDTINLKGVYIDPKQVRSLQGLLHMQEIAESEALRRKIKEKLNAKLHKSEHTTETATESIHRSLSTQWGQSAKRENVRS